MRIRQSVVVVALVALIATEVSFSGAAPVDDDWPEETRGVEMSTNIAVVQSSEALRRADVKVIDPRELLNSAPDIERDDDIEEDPKDEFMTSRSGKLRPRLVESAHSGDNWAEVPISQPRLLHRVKRCGDDDDGGGNANRARVGRHRRRRLRAARNRAAKASRKEIVSKTVTTKVYRNGELVSQKISTPGSVVQAGAPQSQPVAMVLQPATAAQPQPVVVVQQQPGEPQSTPVVVQPAQQVAGGQPQVVVPSLPVQGAVKVN